MYLTKLPFAFAAAALLSACSDKNEETGNSWVPDSNIYSTQVKALEKAEQVETMLMDAQQQRRALIDSQSR